jgi:hypothetical protein
MAQTEFYDYNLNVLFSKDYETAVNTMETGDNDFLRALMEGGEAVLPKLLTRESSGMLGSGNEIETGVNIVSDYFDVVRFPLGEFLNSEMAAALFHQYCGGAITDTPVVGSVGAIDHDFGYALDSDARGMNVLTRSFIFSVGGIKYVFGGVGVDEFGIDWNGGEFPKYKIGLIGTGYHKPLSDYGTIVIPSLESQIPYNYVKGVGTGTKLEFTGAPFGGLYNAAASGRFLGFSFNGKNNIKAGGKERQPNDPIITDADGNEGAVQNRLRRGKREATARITLRQDNLEREFKAQKSKAIMTGLKVVFPGPKIGATASRFQFAMTIPKFRIETVTPDTQDGEKVLHLDLKIYKDAVSGGHCTGSIRNDNASGILAIV